MPELKLCPWPHRKPDTDENVPPPEVDTGHLDWRKGWWVVCPWCDATGPFCSTEQAAVEAWNTRPPHPDTVRLAELIQAIDAATSAMSDFGKDMTNKSKADLYIERLSDLYDTTARVRLATENRGNHE